MRGPAAQPIVIAAGGTGGHFFPAEALAAELIARGQRVVLMTDARSGAANSPVFAQRERHVLKGAGIAGRGWVRAGKALLSMAAGIAQARSILAGLNASAIIGFGGYPSVAPILAARLLRRRPAIILHEQNAVLGRANRFLCQRADSLALSFAATQRVPTGTQTTVTGNPVRPAIAALSQAAYKAPGGTSAVPTVPNPAVPNLTVPNLTAPGQAIRLLILGGSLGARVFSDIVPDALALLAEPLRARLSVVQQCRPEDLDRVRAAYTQAGITADLAAFFPDVAERLLSAHLVIARAGASTVAELAVVGRPSILVPLPGAIDDHQSANARALAAAGGAVVMPQADLTPRALADRLTTLLADPATLTRAAVAARDMARVRAAVHLADLVESRMHQEARS